MPSDTVLPDDPSDGPFLLRFYTPLEVVASGLCCRTTIYRWLWNEILEARQPGVNWKIWGGDLNRLWRKLPGPRRPISL